MPDGSRTANLLVAYLSFILIGLYDGLLGVAWPSIRHTFEVPLDSLGLILAASMGGFFIVGINSGPIISRVGVGWLLLIGQGLRAAGALGLALIPSWWGVIGAALLAGMGNGALDAGLNTYIATRYNPSRLNWLHACYGIGATLAPPLLLTALRAGQAWQLAYLVVAGLQGALTLYFALTLRRWQVRPAQTGVIPAPPSHTRTRDTLRIPVVWLGILLFFLYTGLESAAGQWTYTLFTEERLIAASTAGFWISVYWGTFTAGRILIGFVADRVRTERLLTAGMLGTVVGAALLWWNPVEGVGFAGLALMGFSLAPTYPGLIAVTPRRVGADHTANTIGFQVAAGSLGAAALPGLAGIVARNLGLATVPPYLLGAALLIFALYYFSSLAARRA
jgi:fucose permease